MSNLLQYKLQRIGKQIKLKDLGLAIGVSAQHLSNYENAQRYMADDKVFKYRKYIDSYKQE